MCRSIAFLVYGIPVRTSSLIFAAEAWPRLEKTLPFFDLVSLRLSRGALKVEREEGVAAVSRVSVEVWETVEDELVKIKLEEAEAKFCSDVLGLPNEWGWDWLVDECESDRPYWDSFNGLYEVFISMTFWKGEHGRRLERLLRHFGLSLPPSGLLYLVENPADYVSPCAATFLATPRPSLPDFQTSSIEADCGGDWAPDGHALADVCLSPPHPTPASASSPSSSSFISSLSKSTTRLLLSSRALRGSTSAAGRQWALLLLLPRRRLNSSELS